MKEAQKKVRSGRINSVLCLRDTVLVAEGLQGWLL